MASFLAVCEHGPYIPRFPPDRDAWEAALCGIKGRVWTTQEWLRWVVPRFPLERSRREHGSVFAPRGLQLSVNSLLDVEVRRLSALSSQYALAARFVASSLLDSWGEARARAHVEGRDCVETRGQLVAGHRDDA